MQVQTGDASGHVSLKGYGYAVKVSLIAALGGFLFGFETAVISGAEEKIQDLWQLSSGVLGFTVASSLIGTVVGSLSAGMPAQKFGRKKVLSFIAVMYLLSAIGCALTPVWILFIIFRFIGGIAVGVSSVVGPMYIAEIAPAKVRGRLAGSFQVNVVVGILIAYLVNYLLAGTGENSWRYMLGVMAVPAAAFYLLLHIIPESPRWLVLNNRDDEAIKVFNKTGEHNAMALIKEEHELAKQGIKENLFNGRYKRPILYAMLLAMFNQLSGINALIYYAPRIFEMAGANAEDKFQHSVYIGLANLFFTLLAMSVIDRFGRKKLLLIGAVGMAVFLALTAISFKSGGGAAIIVYLIGFIAFFAFSQGAVIWVFISEIFPNSVRSQGGSLGSFTHWIMAAIVSQAFPVIATITDNGVPTGVMYAFYFFAAMMLLSFIFIWRVMPETKGKSLEDIQHVLGIE